MPPPLDVLTRDSNLLADLLDTQAITLDSFIANPAVTPPCGGPGSTLSWRLTRHPDRAPTSELRTALRSVAYDLTGPSLFLRNVPSVASRVVQPLDSSSFNIFSRLRQVSFFLGSVAVTVDASRCQRLIITESLAQPFVEENLAGLLSRIRDEANIVVTLRSPVVVNFVPGGIELRLRFTFRTSEGEADVDIDTRLEILVQNCRPRVIFGSWEIEADISFLADIFTLGLGDDRVEAEVERLLKPQLLKAFEDFLGGLVPQDKCLCRVIPGSDQIEVQICPQAAASVSGFITTNVGL